MGMDWLMGWTEPSPKRKLTPMMWPLEKASASVTCGLLGMCGPQWASTSAGANSDAVGSRRDGTTPLVTAPTHVVSDMVVDRSPTKIVLLSPSVMLATRKLLLR